MADFNYTSNGSTTVPAGIHSIADARLFGPGGGGAGGQSGRSGGGGGSGGVSKSTSITVVPGETLTWVLPGGGAGGVQGLNPTSNGGTSTAATLTGSVSGVLLRANPGGGGLGQTSSGVDGTGGTGASTSGAVGTITLGGANGGVPTGGNAPDGGGVGGGGGKPGATGGSPGGGGGGKSGTLGGAGGPGGGSRLEFSWGVTVYDYGRVAVSGVARVSRQPQIRKSGVMRNIREAYIVKSGVARPMFRVSSGEVDPEDPPPLTVPAYVPTGHEAKYSPENHTFNFHGTNSSRLKESIQSSGSLRTQWMHLGDSAGDGFVNMSTHKGADSYILKLRDKLIAVGKATLGGTGLVKCRTNTPYRDDRWGKYNNNTIDTLRWQNNWHWITCQNKFNQYALIFESDKPGTNVDILVVDMANVEVRIDDGTPIILPGTGTMQPMIHTISGLSNTIHKVSVNVATHAQRVGISAVDVYNSTGLVVHNPSQGGAKVATGQTGQPVWSDKTDPIYNMLPFWKSAKPDPDVVFIELGGNDMRDPVQYTNIQNGFKVLIDEYPNSDIVLVMMTSGSTSGFTAPENFPRYWEETMETALDRDIMLIDTHSILGGFDNMVANGWNGDQYGHLNLAGATYLGNTMAMGIINELGL
jgi:lysophospholipase L1-like esterase